MTDDNKLWMRTHLVRHLYRKNRCARCGVRRKWILGAYVWSKAGQDQWTSANPVCVKRACSA